MAGRGAGRPSGFQVGKTGGIEVGVLFLFRFAEFHLDAVPRGKVILPHTGHLPGNLQP